MITNVFLVDELRALARARMKSFAQMSVPPSEVAVVTRGGWVVMKQGKTSVRIRREKRQGELFQDRIWSLLYKMDMLRMSAEDGAKVQAIGNASEEGTIDVAALDDEVFLAVQCISEQKYRATPDLLSRMETLFSMRDRLSRATAKLWPVEYKRNLVLCIFAENVEISDGDRDYAEKHNISIFDEADLDYYEKLASHIGAASKYQLFADMLPGKTVPGLTIRVPAVRTRMGPQSCLTFPISPEYLLKIAYVSHRSKGKASDVHTYQRMMKKSRLQKIRDYISDRGVFPTNIVINIDKRFISFERVKQDTGREDTDSSGVLGWLTIKPAYKSAWVIDGQHRLFAYSGHEYARTGHLSVLAFEGITPSSQAKLFVDINAKQKSVRPSLLQELFAELHWDAESPSTRVQAIISKAVQSLDAEKGSPFKGRIQTADAPKDGIRCISLASVFRALERHEFFIEAEAHNEVVTPGPFWAGTNDRTLERVIFILKRWFAEIAHGAEEWWELGSSSGGGLAMNDSVVACVSVLSSVLQHVQVGRSPLARLDKEALWSMIKPYANVLGIHFGGFSADERQRYRELRGSQGQTTRTRRAQQAIKSHFIDFNPAGLDDFLRREKEQTNLRGKEIIDRLEILIQKIVLQELKQEFGADESGWWHQGIPRPVRTAAVTKAENDDNRRRSREAYFELIDYRTIILSQWPLFQTLLGIGKKTDSKDRQTKWLVDLNDMRRIVAHSSSGISLSMEQVNELQVFESTLSNRSASIGGELGDIAGETSSVLLEE